MSCCHGNTTWLCRCVRMYTQSHSQYYMSTLLSGACGGTVSLDCWASEREVDSITKCDSLVCLMICLRKEPSCSEVASEMSNSFHFGKGGGLALFPSFHLRESKNKAGRGGMGGLSTNHEVSPNVECNTERCSQCYVLLVTQMFSYCQVMTFDLHILKWC